MKLNLQPGKYIVAVSGGVDSLVLLDLLSKSPGLELVVGHFNHGIRPQADKDEAFVAQAAKRLGLAYESGYGRLGPKASEDTARVARYKFLNDIKAKHRAGGIITAHHQDDLIETALLNLLRGSGYKGLVAIKANRMILRPLLNIPKAEILKYAKAHRLLWREDESNSDLKYLRNYLRRRVLAKLTPAQRAALLGHIEKTARIDRVLSSEIATLSHKIKPANEIDRRLFAILPHKISNELVAFWLRSQPAAEFDERTVNRLSLALKTARHGSTQPVKAGLNLQIAKQSAHFSHTLR